MVLVHDQDHPRGFWKMARVQSLITGKDGVARGATLKVASKSGTPTTLQRPLQLLFPLEVSSDSPTTNVMEPESESTKQQTASAEAPEQEEAPPGTSRPQRGAAIRGRKLVKQWCTSEDLVDHS